MQFFLFFTAVLNATRLVQHVMDHQSRNVYNAGRIVLHWKENALQSVQMAITAIKREKSAFP